MINKLNVNKKLTFIVFLEKRLSKKTFIVTFEDDIKEKTIHEQTKSIELWFFFCGWVI